MIATIHSDVLSALVSDKAWSRAIFIDAEPSTGAATFDIVLRGLDKVLVGAKPSTASSTVDAKEHKPALKWCDESASPRRYILATCDTLEGATVLAEQLAEFYASAPERSDSVVNIKIPTTFDGTGAADDIVSLLSDALAKVTARRDNVNERLAKLCNVGREILTSCLIPVFGSEPNGEQSKGNRIGIYADYLADREPKGKLSLASKALAKAESAKAEANAILAQSAALLANVQTLANVPGAPDDLQAKLAALLAQLQTATSGR